MALYVIHFCNGVVFAANYLKTVVGNFVALEVGSVCLCINCISFYEFVQKNSNLGDTVIMTCHVLHDKY